MTTTTSTFRIETFATDGLRVLHFPIGPCETFSDWDWFAMRRACYRRIDDEEDRHLALIALSRLERQWQTTQLCKWRREPRRNLSAAAYLAAGVVFWLAVGVLACAVWQWLMRG